MAGKLNHDEGIFNGTLNWLTVSRERTPAEDMAVTVKAADVEVRELTKNL